MKSLSFGNMMIFGSSEMINDFKNKCFDGRGSEFDSRKSESRKGKGGYSQPPLKDCEKKNKTVRVKENGN